MTFWDTDESVQAQSYYFATLCGYSPTLHLPYQKYLERVEAEKNGDIFTGVGSSVDDDDDTSDQIVRTVNQVQNVVQNDDLSWLKDLLV